MSSNSDRADAIDPSPAPGAVRHELPPLDDLQIGHLRHIVRLARQLPGDWSDMGPFDPSNEGDDAYRYQLAYMAYALGVTQFHHLPAYRELLQGTFQSLIDKMLRQDVWGYWELTSRGSKAMDPDLDALVEGWIDPVRSKNIMYSGHLLMMVSMYEMLYRDGRYDAPGSLTFESRPPLRGMGPQDFPYDHGLLLDAIAEEFRRNDGLGCECEPNAIFVYCNQFPLLGMMHYDHVKGTQVAGPLMRDFEKSWAARSQLFSPVEKPDLPMWFQVRQQSTVTEGGGDDEAVSVLSWGSVMHAWQPDYVERLYPAARDEALETSPVGLHVRLEQFHRTHLDYQSRPSADLVDPMMLGVHTHGMVSLLAAELGDGETLEGLLRHADARMAPTWKDGGLFYPRCDALDTDRYMTRVTGNALLAAARLTPKNGLRDLYESPWTARDLLGPQLVNVPYPDMLVTRAVYDAAGNTLSASFHTDEARRTEIAFDIVDLDVVSPLAVCLDGAELGTIHPADGWQGSSHVRWSHDRRVLGLSVPTGPSRTLTVGPARTDG